MNPADRLFPVVDRTVWPLWPPHCPYENRLLLARIAWDLRENGPVEAADAVHALRMRLAKRGVAGGNNFAASVRAAAKIGLIVTERRADGLRRLGAIRPVPAEVVLPPNPWTLERPPVVEPAPVLRSVPEPQKATEAPLELPQGRWAGLSREQQLLAIMDLAGLALIDELTAAAPVAPAADVLERLADALADNARLRTEVDTERRRRRDAEGAAESHVKALRAERRRAQLIQTNLDALVAGIAKGPAAPVSEVARLMQQRPVAR